MPKVSSVFIETLKNHKVDRFFCVPGESYLPVMNELVSNPIIDVVTCRHEGGAGFMAVADAKCTGEPGIAYVSRGPGATNISIAVHSAHQGGIPMIVFVGQVSRKNLGKMHLQEMDFTKTFADMTKLVEEIKEVMERRKERIAELRAEIDRIEQDNVGLENTIGELLKGF